MNLCVRLLTMLCVFAGLAVGMLHSNIHGAMEECATHCVSGHGHDYDSHDDHDHGGHDSHDHDKHDHEGDSVPHQHTCCLTPSADRATETISLQTDFLCMLVEIDAERSLVPDEPVFALDKPPLI